jgi:hypothetical protein
MDMTETELQEKLEHARELLAFLETPGGKKFLELINETLKAIPHDALDFVGVDPQKNVMTVDTVKIAFFAGGKTYLNQLLERLDEVRAFVKKVAEDKIKMV